MAFLARLFRRSDPASCAWIEIADLHRRMQAGEAMVLIDVRQPEEFDAPPGHLPGARNVPLATITEKAGDIGAYGCPVVLIGKSDRRSARAAADLNAAGLQGVSVLRGGTDEWHRRGLPLDGRT